MKERYDVYTGSNNFLYVVYDHKCLRADFVDNNFYDYPGFSLSDTEQMASHFTGEF